VYKLINQYFFQSLSLNITFNIDNHIRLSDSAVKGNQYAPVQSLLIVLAYLTIGSCIESINYIDYIPI
jgi:hypothetical protein